MLFCPTATVLWAREASAAPAKARPGDASRQHGTAKRATRALIEPTLLTRPPGCQVLPAVSAPAAGPSRSRPLSQRHGPAARYSGTPAALRRLILEASLPDGQLAVTDPVSVDHGNRMFEIKPAGMSEDAVQKRQHLVVRIRSASEEDDTRVSGIIRQHEPRIVEI